MAFTTLTSGEIAAGEPVKQELFQKTKDNFDDHEARIASTEAAVGFVEPITFGLLGPYPLKGNSQTGVLYYRLTNSITVLAIRLFIFQAGTAGTTQVDVLYKRGANPFVSLFSTLPSVGFAAGNFGLSTDGVLSTTSLLSGDILRLDLTSVQTGGAEGAEVIIEYEV